jgi:beta-lactamase regulating signal transducer with metallopeptidase domain
MSELIVAFVVNAAWQAAAIGCAGLLLARMLRPRHAFQLLALTLVACAVAPLLTLFAPRTAVLASTIPSVPRQSSEAIAITYVAGLLFFALRLAYRAWRAQRIVWSAAAAAAAFQSGSRGCRTPKISDAIDTPVTIGRTILLPPFVASHARLLGAALAHEDAHVRRNDYALHLALEAIALPLYFHPLVFALRRAIGEARELACDEEAALHCGRREYAEALVEIAALAKQSVPGMRMAAAPIERRIAALVKPVRGRSTIGALPILIAIAAACTRFDAAPGGSLQGQWELDVAASDLSEVMAPPTYDGFTQTIAQGPHHIAVRQVRRVRGRTEHVRWSVITDGKRRPIPEERDAQAIATWRNGALELQMTGPGKHRENATVAVRAGRLICDGITERGSFHAEFRRID